MRKEKTWHEEIFDELETVTNSSYQLSDMARAFSITGNDTLSEELYKTAAGLRDASTTIQKAIGKHSNEDFKTSEQSSKNMIMAALAMTGVLPGEESC